MTAVPQSHPVLPSPAGLHGDVAAVAVAAVGNMLTVVTLLDLTSGRRGCLVPAVFDPARPGLLACPRVCRRVHDEVEVAGPGGGGEHCGCRLVCSLIDHPEEGVDGTVGGCSCWVANHRTAERRGIFITEETRRNIGQSRGAKAGGSVNKYRAIFEMRKLVYPVLLYDLLGNRGGGGGDIAIGSISRTYHEYIGQTGISN